MSSRRPPTTVGPREPERMWRCGAALQRAGSRTIEDRSGKEVFTVNTSYVPGRTAESVVTGTLGVPGMAPPLVGVAATPGLAVDVDAAAPRDRVRWGPVFGRDRDRLRRSALSDRHWHRDWHYRSQRGQQSAKLGYRRRYLERVDPARRILRRRLGRRRSGAQSLEVSGLLDGFVTGAAALLLLVWLTTTAVTGALGFFATTVADIAGAAAPAAVQATNGNVPTVDQTTNAVDAVVPDQADRASAAGGAGGAAERWSRRLGTAIAIALAIIAAMLGGKAGQAGPAWSSPERGSRSRGP